MSEPIDRLGFGCVAITTLPSRRAVRRLLEFAFDLGVRHFDTAPVYGRGYSEILLGEFLRGRRAKVSVATKFGLWPVARPTLPTWLALPLNAARRRLMRRGPAVQGASPVVGYAGGGPLISRSDVAASFEASRRALGTEYIDLFLLHEALPARLGPGACDYLQRMKETGAIRQIGLAANGRSCLALDPSDVSGWDVLQYESGPAWPESSGLLVKFPTQTHIFHSCLKGVSDDTAAPGRVLAERLAANPSGRVLFSSSRLQHIRSNVAAVSGEWSEACRS
jgi:hypothetical protein